MEPETVKFLIERKIDFVNSIAQMGMLWWVSSVVFCGSVLAAVWSKQDNLKKQRLVNPLGFILSGFFLSMVVFGGMVIYYLIHTEGEIAALASNLKTQDNFFRSELFACQLAMWLGTSSFFLVLIVWICFWIHLSRKPQKEIQGAKSFSLRKANSTSLRNRRRTRRWS